MDSKAAKGVSILILFALTLLFGWLPIWLHHRGTLSANASPRRKMVLDVLNCFAGECSWAPVFCTFWPRGEEFEDYEKKVGLDLDFPLYETLAAVGLFLVAFVEKVGFAVISCTREKEGATSTASESPALFYTPLRADMDTTRYGAASESKVAGNSAEQFSSFVNGSYRRESEEREPEGLTSSVKVMTPAPLDLHRRPLLWGCEGQSKVTVKVMSISISGSISSSITV